jgi:pimeloyl-ACP methyl ester carboxylesterase
VGHSYGAWVAGRALPSLGTAVQKFVAVGGVPGIDEPIAGRSAGFAAALEAGQLTLDAAATVAADLWLPTQNRSPEEVAVISDLIQTDTVERLARVLRRQTDLADPARWVAPYDVPSVSIHNIGDRGAPIALGRKLAELGSRSEWIELEGDGHYPQWSHADAVARAVFGG